MKFKAKLRKIGNSQGIIVPKEVITFIEDEWQIGELELGASIYLDVITNEEKYMDLPDGVITENDKKTEAIVRPISAPDGTHVVAPKKKLVFNAKTGMNEWK